MNLLNRRPPDPSRQNHVQSQQNSGRTTLSDFPCFEQVFAHGTDITADYFLNKLFGMIS